MLYKNYITGKVNSFPLIGLAGEEQCIFGSQDDFYLFHPLNIVPCDEDGKLMDT